MTESSAKRLHALWMFDVDDFDRIGDYFRFAIDKMPAHGGRPIAMGRFQRSEKGDIAPRQFYVLAEWDSIEVFRAFAENATVAEAHSDREDATSSTIRHMFDGVDLTDPAFRFDDDILPLLKP
jgi:uncharacterized protein (DUF1330 family)